MTLIARRAPLPDPQPAHDHYGITFRTLLVMWVARERIRDAVVGRPVDETPDVASYLRGCETSGAGDGQLRAVVVCFTSETAVPMIDTLIACMSPLVALTWMQDTWTASRSRDDPLKVGRSGCSRQGCRWNVDNRGALGGTEPYR